MDNSVVNTPEIEKSKFEKLTDKAASEPMQEVTPNPETIGVDIPEPEAKKSFSFEDIVNNAEKKTQDVPPGQMGQTVKPENPKQHIAGFEAIARVFEKGLDEFAKWRHGVTLEDIGAQVDDKDMKRASDIYGEGAANGSLPVIPEWLVLIALLALIFGFTAYKVISYAPGKVARPKSSSITDGVNLHEDINPRTGQPYTRGRYNKQSRKRKR